MAKKFKSKKLARNKNIRHVGSICWMDESLNEWPKDDYRIFVGNLGEDATNTMLQKAFNQYKSLQKVKVIVNKITKKNEGYGFVSFSDPQDMLNALKEKNGQYIGQFPVIVKPSKHKERELKDSSEIMNSGARIILNKKKKRKHQHLF